MKKVLITLITLFLITAFYTHAYTSPENEAVFQLGNDKFTYKPSTRDTILYASAKAFR